MNRQVRATGINGDQTGHFEEIAPGDWRGVDIERTAGISIYNYKALITRLADLIGGGWQGEHYVYRLDVSLPPTSTYVDQMGNTWIGTEYLPPHLYLVRLIPPALEVPDSDGPAGRD